MRVFPTNATRNQPAKKVQKLDLRVAELSQSAGRSPGTGRLIERDRQLAMIVTSSVETSTEVAFLNISRSPGRRRIVPDGSLASSCMYTTHHTSSLHSAIVQLELSGPRPSTTSRESPAAVLCRVDDRPGNGPVTHDRSLGPSRHYEQSVGDYGRSKIDETTGASCSRPCGTNTFKSH
jgi:hypothetical protein